MLILSSTVVFWQRLWRTGIIRESSVFPLGVVRGQRLIPDVAADSGWRGFCATCGATFRCVSASVADWVWVLEFDGLTRFGNLDGDVSAAALQRAVIQCS